SRRAHPEHVFGRSATFQVTLSVTGSLGSGGSIGDPLLITVGKKAGHPGSGNDGNGHQGTGGGPHPQGSGNGNGSGGGNGSGSGSGSGTGEGTGSGSGGGGGASASGREGGAGGSHDRGDADTQTALIPQPVEPSQPVPDAQLETVSGVLVSATGTAGGG